jgi:alanine racemase
MISKKSLTWVEVNSENITHNINLLKTYSKSSKTKISAVVKDNAYGMGMVEFSKKAVKSGIDAFDVAFVEEGIKLRKAGIINPIYVLSETPLEMIADAIKYNLVLTINSYESAEKISKKCLNLKKRILVHIKVNTGMNRFGINFREALTDILKIIYLPNIAVEGVFTHFATADEEDETYIKLQWNRFNKVMQELKKIKTNIKMFHCANSAIFIRYKNMHLDMARIGLVVYGLNPFSKSVSFLDSEAQKLVSDLKPVLSLKSRITFIENVPAGEYISYGRTFKTSKESIIAAVPVGYSHGYFRLLSNKSKVIVNGEFAPVVGNITMDHLLIDITDVKSIKKISPGQEVILIGDSNGKSITAGELASIIGTISYEIISALKCDIPRIYI